MMTAAAPISTDDVRAARRASFGDAIRQPLSTSASGMFGVTTRARGSSSTRSVWMPSSSSRRVAARRDHHRVEDHQRQIQLLDRRGNRFDDGRRREHADLGRVDADVAGDRFDLRGDEIGRQRRERRDAERVLSGDGGDGARAVDAERGEGLEIGLNAGASARIAAGDGQRRPEGRHRDTRV